jgi:3',5'-nucleoside bisphosphate phosphatase
MRNKVEPLLCELHAHSTWSDGAFDLPDLVDLYGRSGFDVLCVTDHAPGGLVDEQSYDDYLAAIDAEAARARRRYGLLVLPGLELTLPDAHAVAVGLREFVSIDGGLEDTLGRARAAGAALIAAHPFRTVEEASNPGRATLQWARDWETLAPLVDRWELFNREQLFGWVAERGLSAVANGDFHRLEHLHGWKTLLPCRKDADDVVAYLRSPRPAFLTRIARADELPAAA